MVATKKKLGPHQLCSSIGRTADLIGPKLIRRVLFSCYIFLVMAGASSLWMDRGKTWTEAVVQLLRLTMEEEKEPRPAIVHHGPQAQDKSCSRGLVMTWFLPRPWPAFHGQLGPGVGLFIRLGWDMRGWCGMYGGGMGCTADWIFLVM